MTRLRAGRPRNLGSISGRAKGFSVGEFSGSRSAVVEDSVFPGYVAASLFYRFPTFRDSELTLSSKVRYSFLDILTLEDEAAALSRTVGNHLLNCRVIAQENGITRFFFSLRCTYGLWSRPSLLFNEWQGFIPQG